MKTGTVGEYLLARLHQAGIEHLFGVAGDQQLYFVDYLDNYPAITWVPCTNEQNAVWAADGYAHCKPAAALLTASLSGIHCPESVALICIIESTPPQHQTALTAANACEEIERKLAEAVAHRRAVYLWLSAEVAAAPARPPLFTAPAAPRNAFWPLLQRFLQPGDLLVAEQGMAAVGATALHLPEHCQLLVQQSPGAAGYSLPAAFGAQTADPRRRVIVIIDAAAAQRTIPELSSMMRDGLRPVIFLLNNAGVDNNIACWDWTLLPQALSLASPVQSWRVVEAVQLSEVMQVITHNPRMSLVEVIMAQLDISD